MKTATLYSTLTCLLVFAAPQVFAKEGLSYDLKNAPTAVKAAWDRVYSLAIAYPQADGKIIAGVDTALYVGRENSDRQTYLLFLTADHVLEDLCEEGQLCKNFTLSANSRVYMTVDPKANWRTRLAEKFHLWWSKFNYAIEPSKPSFTTVYALKRSRHPDLAILGVPVSDREAKAMPLPLAMETRCDQLKPGDKLYTVGFSMTRLREGVPHLPIMEENVDTKRWSEGVMTNAVPERTEFLYSTVDALMGSAGGPLLNDQGHVVSILMIGYSHGPDKFAYIGDEDPNHYKPQVFGVGCKFMEKMEQIIRSGSGTEI